jgi:hypothetical protein
VAIFNNGGGVTETDYTPAEVAGTETVVGPTIFGHTAAASALSVAAINVGTNEEPEAYSSRGPVVHLFGPVEGTEAALSIGEETIAKPNLTASDCGQTTFFYGRSEGGFHFCGTSAAAPHAAAVAALIRSANPGATNDQVRAALEATARPIGDRFGTFGPSAVGAGLLDADSAVAALALPPTVTITGPPAATSEVTQPQIAFAASRRAIFTCQVDAAAATPCTSPYRPPAPLAEGDHEFKVTATDAAGRSASATARFRVETKSTTSPPRPSSSSPAPPPVALPVASFSFHPRPIVRIRKKRVRLEFGLVSNTPDATFRCKVDKGEFVPCRANFRRRFRLGRHAVSGEAVDAAGNVGEAVTFRFQVRRVIPRHKGHRAR